MSNLFISLIGFTEESFKVYQANIRKFNFENQKKLRENKEFDEQYMKDQNLKSHQTLSFYLPHEFGGCGAPFFEKEKYDMFNIFHEDKDLAIIKPRWTIKQEFKVDLPPNSKLDEQNDDEVDLLEEPYSAGAQRISSQLSIERRPSISTKEGQLDFARKNFCKTVINDFEKDEVPALDARIDELRKELEKEKGAYEEIEKKK